MVNKLKSQGYNVERQLVSGVPECLQAPGVNADRDLGLLAQFEKQVTKKGQPVSMSQFMDEAQNVYNDSYKGSYRKKCKTG